LHRKIRKTIPCAVVLKNLFMEENAESRRGIRPGVLLTVLVSVGILVGAIVFSKRKPSAPENRIAEAPVENSTPAPVAPSSPGPPRTPSVISKGQPSPPPTATLPPTTSPQIAAVSPVTPITNWEQRIDSILGSDNTDEAKKADELLALFPTLPEDGQLEAAQHISNLLPDEKYPAIAPMLTNAVTSEPVLDALLTDLLNRPDTLKLPMLLQIARIPEHPKASEARDILEVYVDENFGNDWPKWEAALQKYLKENSE
jgi:hypothetical protein